MSCTLAFGALLLSCKGPTGPAGSSGAPGVAGPPGPAVASGYQIIEQTVWANANQTGLQELDVQCPVGKMAVGGGFAFSDPRVDVRVSRPYRAVISPPPPNPPTGWDVMLYNNTGSNSPGYIYVVCLQGN